jgi:hypothetical protein
VRLVPTERRGIRAILAPLVLTEQKVIKEIREILVRKEIRVTLVLPATLVMKD